MEKDFQMSEAFKEEAIKELRKLGELVSRNAVETVFKITESAVKDSENKFDDLVIAFLPKLKETVLMYIDKISEDV